MPADFPDPMDFPGRPAERDHRRVEHSLCAVLRHHSAGDAGESANLLSLGAVDFGIIVDSAVILVENIFRNFQRPAGRKAGPASTSDGGLLGAGPDGRRRTRPPVPRMDGPLAADSDQRDAMDKAVFSQSLIIVAAFVPLFTMQGVEGAIFGPMARTYAYALAGALIATFTVTPVLASLLLPEHVKESETLSCAGCIAFTIPRCASRWPPGLMVGMGIVFLAVAAFFGSRLGSEFLPALDEGNFGFAPMPMTTLAGRRRSGHEKNAADSLKYPEVITVVSQHGRPDDGSDASPFSNVELFVPLKPYGRMAKGNDQGQIDQRQDPGGFRERIARRQFQLLAIHSGQHRGGNFRRQRRQLGQNRRPQS
jgi:heavy metal efflux system protein